MNGSALAKQEPSLPLAPVEPNHAPTLTIDLAALAANPDVSVDKLERLVAMQERLMAGQAKIAFDEAFSAMQAELPVIIERSHTDKTSYAPLEDIVEPIRPILAKYGFSLSHKTEWPEKGTVKVIGILSHSQGHERQSEFVSPADVGPGRNAVQSLGSAMAYGRRYTVKDLLNIVTRGEDDDAKRAARAPEPDGYADWLDALANKADEGLPALQKMWKVANGDAELRKFVEHLTRAEPQTWNQLKTRAAKAPAVRR